MACQLLSERVVLITGAASGIGKATAEACVAAGVHGLALADVNIDALVQLRVDLLNKRGAPPHNDDTLKILVMNTSVQYEDHVRHLVSLTMETFGRLDGAFNNAGIEGERAPIAKSDTENFDHVMNVNAKGVYHCMKYELEQFMLQREAEIELGDEKIPAMGAAAKPAPKKKKSWNDSNRSCSEKQPRRFAIVNCASTAGLHGMPEFSAYCASKHAIIGLTKSAALEYAAHNIRINALCPSTTDTPMVERFQSQWPEWQAAQNDSIPVGRIGTPEEMANAVVWMLSDQCTFMTGHCLCVDGGGTC